MAILRGEERQIVWEAQATSDVSLGGAGNEIKRCQVSPGNLGR